MIKMLTSKFNLPALLTLILGLGLMSGSFAQRSALAGRIDTVPSIEVTLPAQFQGQYLHVLYAVGRPGFLTVSEPTPYIDIVRPQSQGQLVNSTKVTFPAVQIEKTPGRGSYNMIVFAVSRSPQMRWVNVDVNPNPTEYRYVGVILKPEVDAFTAQFGEGSTIQISF